MTEIIGHHDGYIVYRPTIEEVERLVHEVYFDRLPKLGVEISVKTEVVASGEGHRLLWAYLVAPDGLEGSYWVGDYVFERGTINNDDYWAHELVGCAWRDLMEKMLLKASPRPPREDGR